MTKESGETEEESFALVHSLRPYFVLIKQTEVDPEKYMPKHHRSRVGGWDVVLPLEACFSCTAQLLAFQTL